MSHSQAPSSASSHCSAIAINSALTRTDTHAVVISAETLVTDLLAARAQGGIDGEMEQERKRWQNEPLWKSCSKEGFENTPND